MTSDSGQGRVGTFFPFLLLGILKPTWLWDVERSLDRDLQNSKGSEFPAFLFCLLSGPSWVSAEPETREHQQAEMKKPGGEQEGARQPIKTDLSDNFRCPSHKVCRSPTPVSKAMGSQTPMSPSAKEVEPPLPRSVVSAEACWDNTDNVHSHVLVP